MVNSWVRCGARALMILALSVAPMLPAVCELLCSTAVEVEAHGIDHHAHASTNSSPPSAHHGTVSGTPVDNSSQASLQAVVNPGCCTHDVAAPPASRTVVRSERGPVLTDAFAVLIETASAAPSSREAAPEHRPPISPPTPNPAPLVLRI